MSQDETREAWTEEEVWAVAAATLNDHADIWEDDGSDPCRVRVCREMANAFRSYAEGTGVPSHRTLRQRRDEARAERDEARAALDRVRARESVLRQSLDAATALAEAAGSTAAMRLGMLKAARERADQAEAALDRVRTLHQLDGARCGQCHRWWPCPTDRALATPAPADAEDGGR